MAADADLTLQRVDVSVVDISDLLAIEVVEHDQDLFRVGGYGPALVKMSTLLIEREDL